MFQLQENLSDIIPNGGYTVKSLNLDFVIKLEESIKNLCGYKSIKNEDFLKKLYFSDDERISELFDILNSCGNVLGGHLTIQDNYIKEVFDKPLIWTYPNVRIDKKSRSNYIAPPHLDEWILFNKNRGIVVWFPLFSDGFLKIYDGYDKIKVVKDSYWGLKAENTNSYKVNEQLIKRGQVLFFRSDLLHESSLNIDEEKVRLSIQYRYHDLNSYPKPFKRTIIQNISPLIQEKQSKLAQIGKF
jgi:hypothetical protein